MVKKFKSVGQTEVRTVANHECGLTLCSEPVTYKIYQGLFVASRRRLWKWMTIDAKEPSHKIYLKSAPQVYEEEIRHLESYPYMIHTFSRLRYHWELTMSVVWLLQFFFIPSEISTAKLSENFFYAKIVLNCFCYIDMILWFLTGYFDNNKRTVVLSFKNVAKKYFFTYFFVDLLSSLPITFILHQTGKEQYHYLTSLALLKLLRLGTLFSYLRKFSERHNIKAFHTRVFCAILSMTLFISWSTCGIYMLQLHINPEPLLRTKNYPMLILAFRVTRCLMVVGITDKVNSSIFLMLYKIFCICAGSILRIIVLATVAQFFQKRSSSRNKYKHLLEQISEYMEYKELPMRLRKKIFRYIDFKFQKHIFREEDVLNNLSSVLKHDILLQRCHRMVRKVDFFKDLPPHLLVRIVTKLRSEIFLPSDVIVLAGYAGHAMYFIYIGTVAIYTANGKEVCHLDDGSHFGEIALLINEPRVATVIAVKECELFKLSRKDFQEAIEPYPELYKKIRLLAMQRLETTLQIMSDNKEQRKVRLSI